MRAAGGKRCGSRVWRACVSPSLPAAGLVALGVLSGCGGSAPPAEPSQPLIAPAAPRAEAPPADLPETETPSPEAPSAPPSSDQSQRAGHSATIREYLANHFIFKGWYRQVHGVTLGSSVATVLTSLPAGGKGRGSAAKVCRAVLASKHAERVVVLYGSKSSLVC
jgi:hypothetical protein